MVASGGLVIGVRVVGTRTIIMETACVYPPWASKDEEFKGADHGQRFYVPPPGTDRNPLVFRHARFVDVEATLGDDVRCVFEDCEFERAPIHGDYSRLRKGCRTVDKALPHTDDIMDEPGTAANPIIFHKRTFAHLRIDMGEVHALFNGCLFYECDLRGFANCVISNPVFEWNPHAYLAHRLVFYCAAGVGKHVFGEIATLPDPDYIYKQSYEDVTAAVMAGTVWGRVRDGVVRVRSGMVRAKQRVASLRVSVATTTTASAV